MAKDIFKELLDRIGVDVPWHVIDEVVVTDPNTLRPVKGYAFEVIFDEIANKYLKCLIEPGPGGDSDIDRFLTNNSGQKYTLQIKTCVTSTIKENIHFGVSLHKTHGEERRPNNLYPTQWPCPYCPHEGGAFPDFLIAQHPENGVLIVPKDHIPQSKSYPGHYDDPAVFKWHSQWLNRWELLGFPSVAGKSLERRSVPKQKKLPRIAEIVHLTDEEIVRMWLAPENFRTIDMNLKGNLRQPALAEWLRKNGVDNSPPIGISYPKYDRITSKGVKVQIKGPSRHLCDVTNSMVGVEVMGSHGQYANRRYFEEDFDYLGFVIDPQYIPNDIPLDKSKYHFCLISIKDLPLHYKNKQWGTTNKIYENCKFQIKSDNSGCFLVPSKRYRLPIKFRGHGPWYFDKVPSNI